MSDDPSTHDPSDVTAHTGHERWLAPNRAEFERITELNAVVRGVNTALISAGTREEMAEVVCGHLADSELYQTVCMADCPTWTGHADRWTVAGVSTDEGWTPPVLDTDNFDATARSVSEPTSSLLPSDGDRADGWTVVPIAYDQTVYGALGLLSPRPPVADRERDVLEELGEVIGHAINAAELRRLLADEAVIELELGHSDPTNPLVEAARRAACRFELAGLIPVTENGSVAYLRVEKATAEAARKDLAAASDGEIRTVRESEAVDGGLVAWAVGADSLLGHGANVTGVTADGDTASYTVEVASDADVRALLDRVQHVFPETWLNAKRELNRPIDTGNGLSENGLEKLTTGNARYWRPHTTPDTSGGPGIPARRTSPRRWASLGRPSTAIFARPNNNSSGSYSTAIRVAAPIDTENSDTGDSQ